MHELSTVIRLVNLAEKEAAAAGAAGVKSMTVRIGEMTGILPEYVRKYFPEAVKGTMLEKAELILEEEPVQTKCGDCGRVYRPSREKGYACPDCGSIRGKVVAGRETRLISMELIMKDD